MTRKLTFLILALFALIASPGRAEVVSGTTYETKSTSSLPNGWTGNGGGNSYIQLTSSSNHITTDNFIQNGFTSIVLKARKYGGPSDAQALITVSWYDAATSNETVLGTIAPTNTTLTDYTISSPTNPTGNTSGYIKIQCKGASSGKGSGVSEVTISYTAGSSTDPSITVNPTTITWDNSPINVQLSETISVSQANLTSDITITSTIGNVSPSTITVGEDATDVILTYTPTTTGDFEGEITFTSGETTATVSVTGSAYDPSQVDTYELFTGELVEGDYVIYYDGKAMKNTVTSNRLDYSEVSPENNVITNPDAAIVWHIAPSGDYWTIFNAAVAKYAAGNGTKNQATLLTDGTDNGSLWTVSGTETHDFTNKKNTSNSVNATLRNNGTYGFACYATGTGGALTLYKKAENKAATPTLTESQIFTTKPFEVTITNNEAGATVYYTTNGDDPTTETTTNFTGASTTININATTTVKAMAVVEGKANSEIASATYTEQKTDPENQWSAEAYTATIGGENTFPTFSTQSNGAVTYTSSNTNAATIDATGTITLVAAGTTTITASTAETDTYMAGEASYTLTVKEAPLATMDAIFAKATAVGSTATNVDVTFNNWVISGVKNSNAYLTDNNGEGLIIYTSNHGFKVGDVLNGTIACQIKLYSGASELMGVTSETSGLTVTKNGEITIHEVSIADLSGVNTGAVIKVNNVQYNGTNLVDENSNIIKPYNAVDYNPTFTNGLKYNVTGVYIQFNTTKEIAPRSADDIVPTEPSITVAETLNLPYTESEVETLEVSYENVDFNNIELTLYDVTGATFTGDWFIAYFDEDFNIEYYALANTSSSERKVDIEIYAFGTDGVNDITRVIHVTQAAAPATYNVTLSSNGVVGEPQPVQGSITLSDPTNIPTGFTFAGWTESESNIQFVDNPYTPTSNVILYAVFSRVEGGSGETTWNLVTNSSEIVAGKVIKIAATVSGASVEANNGTFAANGTISSSIMGKVSATISDNKLTNDEGAAEFTIGGTSGNWTLAYDGKLLGATAAKKLAYDDGTTTWSISIGEDAKASIANGTNSYGTILYNRDNPRFTTYTSTPTASMVLPQIFVKTVSGALHYYTRVYNEITTLGSLEVTGPSIILSGYTLTVTGSMTNTNAANLIIEDGAQLFQNSSSVMATVQKNITGYTGDNDNYYLIANPTDNDVVANLTSNEYDLYSFDPCGDEDGYEWINEEGEEVFVKPYSNEDGSAVAVGYLYANSEDVTLEFAGVLNPAGSTDIELTYAEEGEGRDFPGFNLIGNPYACDAYVNGYNFYTMADGEFVINEGSATIAPCEGFFVEATEANQSVTISTAAPVTAPNALSLNVSQNRGNVIDRAIVNFKGSNNLHKFMLNPAHTNLSIAKGGETFAAISTEAEGELPVNFHAEKNGTYTITVNTENIDAEYLHLIDNMTGMDVDLLSTPSYTFEAKTSDYASRFKLVFGVNNTASESSDSNFAYMSDGNLVISDIEGETTLQIVDELGRVISTETVSGSYNKALNLKAGLYILNLNGMTQKIVVE